MAFLLLLLPLALGFLLFDGGGSSGGADDVDPGTSGNDTDPANDVTQSQSGNLTLTGTDSDDLIGGNAGDDLIYGLGGNDELVGFEGKDTIIAGDGDDRLFGLEGNDLLSGNAGQDVIFAGSGNDLLLGMAGNDLAEGDAGDDKVLGGEGFDILGGGDGDDRLLGGNDSDVILGNAGEDILRGNSGNDYLVGGEGSDLVRGNDGDDILFGGATNFYGNAMGDFNATAQFVAATRLGAAANPGFLNGLTPDQALALDEYEVVDQSGFSTDIRDLSSDTLFGDTGDDTIHLESYDIATGGDGNDQFWLRGDVPQGVMTITDFTPGDDIIYIETEIGQTDPVVTVTDAGSDAEIRFDGVLAAEVIGAAGQIAAGDIGIVQADRTQPS